MPQRTHRFGKSLPQLVFLAAALSLLSAVVRRERMELLRATRARKRKIRVAPRRIAASLAFATLFFAGAAFSAGAGNTLVNLVDSSGQPAASSDTTSTDVTTSTDSTATTEPTTTDSAPAEPQPAPQQAAEAAPADQPAADGQPAADQQPSADARRGATGQPATAATMSNTAIAQAQLQKRARTGLVTSKSPTSSAGQKQHGRPTNDFFRAPPVIAPQPQLLRKKFEREPEADEPNVAATVWLQRALPDPTPPSRRLKPAFARRLLRVSKANHVDWALTLAVLRARGDRGAVPADKANLVRLTRRLASLHAKRDAWTTALSLEGKPTFADRTVALKNLYRAVGIKALVKGLRLGKAVPLEADPERQADHDLPGWPLRHRGGTRQHPRSGADRVPR